MEGIQFLKLDVGGAESSVQTSVLAQMGATVDFRLKLEGIMKTGTAAKQTQIHHKALLVRGSAGASGARSVPRCHEFVLVD